MKAQKEFLKKDEKFLEATQGKELKYKCWTNSSNITNSSCTVKIR